MGQTVEWGQVNLTGANETGRGQLLRRAVGMAGKDGKAGKTQPAEQALQANTAGGLSARLRPQNQQPAVGRLRSKNTTAARRCCLAVQLGGGSAVVLAARKAGPVLPTVPTPPIAFACHCPYPLP